MKILVFILLLALPLAAQESYSPETAVACVAPAPDPQFGPRWTYPGSIWAHLAEDHHAGKIIGNYQSLTLAQAEDLHSDLHTTGRTLNVADYGPPSVANTQFTFSPEVFTSSPTASNCPGGVCPVRQVAPVRMVAHRSVQSTRSLIRRGRGNRGWFPRLRAWSQRLGRVRWGGARVSGGG